MRDVGDGTLVAYKVVGFGIAEMLVQHAIQTPSLVLIAVYSVGDLLGSILIRSISKTTRRTDTLDLPW